MKLKTIIGCILLMSLGSRVNALETGPYPTSYSLTEGKFLDLKTRKVVFPYYIYGNQYGIPTDFIASGYMGDIPSLKIVTSSIDSSAPSSIGRTGNTSLKISYNAKGRQGWTGLYWQAPPNNWAKIKGAGFDMSEARYVSFWARGEKGNEVIATIKVGGIMGPYPDSDVATMGPIHLGQEWKQYKLDLSRKDLRYVIGGFYFLLRRADNPFGATIYLDEIVYRGDPAKEVPPDIQAENWARARGLRIGPPEQPTDKVVYEEGNDRNILDKGIDHPATMDKPPRVIYIEKKMPVYIPVGGTQLPPPPKKIVVTPLDFFFDMILRSTEIQPNPFGLGYFHYKWERFMEKRIGVGPL